MKTTASGLLSEYQKFESKLLVGVTNQLAIDWIKQAAKYLFLKGFSCQRL